ncbi:MAG: TonB-dependent receptor [Desulfobacter sp.]|nr:MAG: TonB-dependent receptor [Desulfobacter sp.]
MNLLKHAALPACLLLFWTLPGLAQQPADENVTELEPMVVSDKADRTDPEALVVDIKKIQTPLPSGNILDTMASEAGVQIRRTSQSGTGSGALRVRGFDETRLSVRQNGIPLNRDGSYGNGAVDWGAFSAESLESVEIFKGACPAKYGNTLGGVVNLKTRQPDTTPVTQVSLTAGSLDTLNAGVAHAWKKGNWGWSVSAGHYETDGYLRNNFMDRDRGTARISLDLPGEWEAGTAVDFSRTENGNPVYNRTDSAYYDPNSPLADEKELRGPGISSRLINGAQAWGEGSFTEDKSCDLTAWVARNTQAGSFRIEGRLWNQESVETYYDAADRNKKIYERETDAEDNNWLLSAAFSRRLGDHLLELGGETSSHGWGEQRVKYIDTAYFNGSINFFRFIRDGFLGQEDIMAYHALYVQDTWQVMDRISLELGLRQEWFRADSINPDAFGFTWATGVSDLSETHTDPRLALTFTPWEKTRITARFGIAHRYPTSPEYFWWYLNNATNYFNTDFNSERALQYELGLDQTFDNDLTLFVRGYYYDIKDYISSVSVPGVGSVFYNIDTVEIKGLEAGFSFPLPLHLTLWANATWQEGDKSGDPWDAGNAMSRQLADLPEIMVNAGLTLDDGGPFSARLWINHVDEREHYSGSTLTTLSAYTLVNLSAQYRIYQSKTTTADLVAAAENILDEDYQEKQGYPMAGATVLAGVRFSF